MDMLTGIALIGFLSQVLIWITLPDSPRFEESARRIEVRAMPA